MSSADADQLTARNFLVFAGMMVVIAATIIAVGGILHTFPSLSGPADGGDGVGSPDVPGMDQEDREGNDGATEGEPDDDAENDGADGTEDGEGADTSPPEGNGSDGDGSGTPDDSTDGGSANEEGTTDEPDEEENEAEAPTEIEDPGNETNETGTGSFENETNETPP